MKNYVGMRYVPKYDGTWDKTKGYENLINVVYNGKTYTSKCYVPVGVDIADTRYWVESGCSAGYVDDKMSDCKNDLYVMVGNEANARQDADRVLSARIDTFASLPDGSTTGNAELIDIRTKADGTIATSAGNAVREQVGKLKETIDNVEMVLGYERKNLKNDLIVGSRIETNKLTRDTTTRITTKHIFRINDTDMLHILIPSNTSYRLSIYIYNEDGSFKEELSDFWSNIGEKTYKGKSGWISIIVRHKSNYQVNDDTIKTIQDSGIVIDLISDKKTFYPNTVTYMNQDGDCTLIRTSTGKNILVDMGTKELNNQTKLIKSLTDAHVWYIDLVIISHYHSDHVGNMKYLYDNGYFDSATTFYLPQDLTTDYINYLNGTGKYADKEILTFYNSSKSVIASVGGNVVYPTEHQIINIDNIEFEFFNVEHSEYMANKNDYNCCSLACYMTIGNTVTLLTGDMIENATEKYKNTMRKCDIYKANHHSVTAVNEDWLSSVYPNIVITMISDGMISAIAQDKTHYFIDWCTNEHIPNYVTGKINNDITLLIDEVGYRFLTNVKRFIY